MSLQILLVLQTLFFRILLYASTIVVYDFVGQHNKGAGMLRVPKRIMKQSGLPPENKVAVGLVSFEGTHVRTFCRTAVYYRDEFEKAMQKARDCAHTIYVPNVGNVSFYGYVYDAHMNVLFECADSACPKAA